MFFPETGNQQLTVVARLRDEGTAGRLRHLDAGFDANIATHVDNDIVVIDAPGVSKDQARQAIERC